MRVGVPENGRVPGLSFAVVRRTALARAANRTHYLDLGGLARLQDQRNTPFTPAVHPYYALTYTQLHDALKADGFVIYAGQGDLSKTLFRISTMGHLTRTNIDRLVTCCAKLR